MAKEVSPSLTQRAGSILLYRVEVGVRSNATRPADTVTLVEAMPEGMALVAVVEEPDEGGEGVGCWRDGCCAQYLLRCGVSSYLAVP